MIIIISILIALLIVSGFVMFNMLKKNEILEDFIAKQSDAIDYSAKRLKTIDEKGSFIADDEVGWFFQNIKDIQEALNEFRLR